jgi:hypothetical protein
MNEIQANSVYPLAIPKGVKYLCELCQKTAHLMCGKCRVTYYWYSNHLFLCWFNHLNFFFSK